MSAILAPAMPWKIPSHPEAKHPNKRFALPREFLFHLHVRLGLSPKMISDVHNQMFGVTIWPQGVRNYLKAYGIYSPPEKALGRYCYEPDQKGRTTFYKIFEEVRLDSKN